MIKGTVFDIKEFSVYDGPGVRTTVFLKGCPLRCRWCHNPEGLSPRPEILINAGSCTGCGKCRVEGCTRASDGICSACGKCLPKCPRALRRICGREYTVAELTEVLRAQSRFFKGGGGVTFSGGEPTYQPDFLCETLDLLGKARIHRAVQTCGYCSKSVWERVLDRVDFVLFDIKHTDAERHKLYTAVDNAPILANLERLKRSGIPFIARVPLIAGVNDDAVNLTKTAELLADASNLQRVELLPYNAAAGAKYRMVNLPFTHDFHAPDHVDVSPFTNRGIECRIL